MFIFNSLLDDLAEDNKIVTNDHVQAIRNAYRYVGKQDELLKWFESIGRQPITKRAPKTFKLFENMNANVFEQVMKALEIEQGSHLYELIKGRRINSKQLHRVRKHRARTKALVPKESYDKIIDEMKQEIILLKQRVTTLEQPLEFLFTGQQ